jgi:hypothetical protein
MNMKLLALLKLALAPIQWLFLNFFVCAAAPMRSTDFRSIVEPILNEVFDGVYEQRKGEYLDVFRERNGTPRAYHEEPVLFGFPAAPQLPDGQPVTYQQGGVLFIYRYVYQVFGLAFAITKVLMEDGDHIAVGKTFAEHLAQSMVETKETLPANVLNRAFNSSFLGGDGVSLINSAHPIQGGTLSNQLNQSGALSQTTVEQLLIQIRSAQDNNGKRIRLEPARLVVHPSNMLQAEVVVKSVLRSATANNDLNPIVSMGLLKQPTAVISRLTSPTAWWIKVSNVPRGLQVLMRRHLEKTMEGDFETDSMRYKATERYWAWWTDWRDLWGTPGT